MCSASSPGPMIGVLQPLLSDQLSSDLSVSEFYLHGPPAAIFNHRRADSIAGERTPKPSANIGAVEGCHHDAVGLP
jgi:hypothetical protein